MIPTRKQGAHMAALFGALIIVVLATTRCNANAETPQFAPVNFWVSPVSISTQSGVLVDFDVYMASTTAVMQPNAVGLIFQSCNSAPLQLSTRTRHLANGETLMPVNGGPGAVYTMRWSRPMGAPRAGSAVKLHLSFVAPQGSNFCLGIRDASGLDGPRYVQIAFGMK